MMKTDKKPMSKGSLTLFAAIWTVSFLLSAGTKARGQAYQWQNLSTNDAIAVVQNFESDPQLQVTVVYAPPPNNDPPGPGAEYELTAGDYDYMVSASNATSLSMSNSQFTADPSGFYGVPFDPNTPAGAQMTVAQCQDIAVSFMQAHFPYPSILSSPVQNGGLNSFGWTQDFGFAFLQDLGGGVSGPSNCKVYVDDVKGEVILYMQRYYPVNVSLTPGLTSDQAAASAIADINMTNASLESVLSTGVTYPDPLGYDELSYTVRVYGQAAGAAPGDTDEWDLTVDANSGALIDAEELMSGSLSGAPRKAQSKVTALPKLKRKPPLRFFWGKKAARLAHPPVLIDEKPYFWAGYLKPKTRKIGTRRLGGKDYVPLKAAGDALHVKLTYLTKDRTVHLIR